MTRVMVTVQLDGDNLVLWSPAIGGYAPGFDCVLEWSAVLLRREASLNAVPHKKNSDPERIDRSLPTKETVSSFFGISGWDGEQITCSFAQLMVKSSEGSSVAKDMSMLLSASKDHMPIYLVSDESLVLAMWNPGDKSLSRVRYQTETVFNKAKLAI